MSAQKVNGTPRKLSFVRFDYSAWAIARQDLSPHADHAYFGLILRAYTKNRRGRIEWIPRQILAWCKLPDMETLEAAIDELGEGEEPRVERIRDDEGRVVALMIPSVLQHIEEAERAVAEAREAGLRKTEAARAAAEASRRAKAQSSDAPVTAPKKRRGKGDGENESLSLDAAGEAVAAYCAVAARAALPVPVDAGAARAAVSKIVAKHGPEAWRTALEAIPRSPFLCGSGPNGWRVTIDWLAKPANFEKVLAGNYDGAQEGGGGAALRALRQIGSGGEGE